MELYLISQEHNNDYDTYSAAIVCAPNPETAQKMHPKNGKVNCSDEYGSWCPSEHVKVKWIGISARYIEQGVVLASYHAG